jgi:hypothetical protein
MKIDIGTSATLRQKYPITHVYIYRKHGTLATDHTRFYNGRVAARQAWLLIETVVIRFAQLP